MLLACAASVCAANISEHLRKQLADGTRLAVGAWNVSSAIFFWPGGRADGMLYLRGLNLKYTIVLGKMIFLILTAGEHNVQMRAMIIGSNQVCHS